MHTHPRETLDLIGHDEAEAQIIQALQSGRMPHAWLITGPEGIGKATLAFRLARFLLDGKGVGDSLTVAPESSAAHLIAAGSHPDMLVLERTLDEKKDKLHKNIAVDDVRKVAPFLGLTASQGKWRIILVDGADTLSREGQNALLKTLEEPPEHSVLILTAETGSALLPTIRSRTRQLKLGKLDDAHLRLLGQRHGLKHTDETAMIFLLQLAEGSAARLFRYAECNAHAMAQQWCAFLQTPANIHQRLRLAESWAGRNNNNEAIYYTAREFYMVWLQRLIRAKALSTPLTPLLLEEEPFLQGLYHHAQLDPLLRLWDHVLEQLNTADASNLDPKTVLLSVFDKTASALGAKAA